MQLLEANKLKYGRLLEVDSPYLIARYNAALEGLGIAPTELEKFNIDMKGFSPEIAQEKDDQDYLDVRGGSRHFIILTPEQMDLPVIQYQFSSTHDLMNQFFKENQRALLALTIKDAVFGEIDNAKFEIDDIDDLLEIEQVEFRVRTPTNLLGKAADLKVMVDRICDEPDAWQNDELLNEMVELAKVTGDIRSNELVPDKVVFRHESYWASHFGGIYIFHDAKKASVICDSKAKGFRRSKPWQVDYFDKFDMNVIMKFLVETERVEIPNGEFLKQSGFLKLRYRMKAIAMMAQDEGYKGQSLPTDDQIQVWVQENWEAVKEEGTLPLLSGIDNELKKGGLVLIDDIHPDCRFMVVRANPEHPDRYLVNRLIAEYFPDDFLMLFVFNKASFYKNYEKLSDKQRQWVVEEIKNTYFNNKKAMRTKLYR